MNVDHPIIKFPQNANNLVDQVGPQMRENLKIHSVGKMYS